MNKKFLNYLVILIVVIVFPLILVAQPADPNDVMVPLDGGLAILLGAAAAYGSHKMKEHRKGKKV
jgi:hypothetical protein